MANESSSRTESETELCRLEQRNAELVAALDQVRSSGLRADLDGEGATRAVEGVAAGELDWIVQHLSEALVIWEPVLDDQGRLADVRFVYFNHAYGVLSGLALNQARGKTFCEMWPSKAASPQTTRWLTVCEEVARTGQSQSFETSSGPAAGLHLCTAHRSPHSPHRLYVTFREIGESTRANKRIGELTNEQQTILDTVVGGIARVQRRKIQWANHAFARMFGYDPHELLDADTSVLYAHPDDYERLGRDSTPRLASGEVYQTEAQMKTREGKRMWCSLTGRALKPPDTDAGIIWELQDISERHQSTIALRESEERFRKLVQYSSDVIVVADEQGRQLSVYGPASAPLGEARDPALGTPVFEHVHPDDLQGVQAMFARIAGRTGATGRAECRCRQHGGEWIPTEVVATNLLHDPTIRGIVISLRDISERKGAEQERHKLLEQLQQAMKMEAVGRLAGGIAHDFNNLLTAIVGNIELARLDIAPSDALTVYLDEAHKAAESAGSLTRQLLAFSRKQIIEPKVINLNELIESLRKMLMRIIGEDVALQTVLAQDLGAVRVDPGQFDQVLVNLVVNSRDAMPDGGRLVIETANLDLDHEYCRFHPDVTPGEYVLVAVTDTGHGMDEPVKKRLFEPFFTTKPQGRGTGLGLATIFGAIKQAGGTIDVYSEAGLGTTFKLFLPRVGEPAQALPCRDRPLNLPRGNETVLFVEDEASVRELTRSLLARLGYEVLLATNAGEALSLAQYHGERIDLLMTDVIMPGMNGRDLADRLHALHPDLRVLFTSGYAENIVVHRGIVDERVHFIAKPYSLQTLALKLRTVLSA